MRNLNTLKKCLACLLAVVLCFGMASCFGPSSGSNSTAGTASGSASGDAAAVRTDVNYGLTSDIASLDPTYATDQITTIVYRQLYDTLVDKDENGNWVGKLAESWEISEDGKTYTFHLRQDVTCHDGSNMTSKDVATSINGLVEAPAFGAAMVSMIDCTEVDDYTVEIHLSAPYAPTLEVLYGFGRISSANTTDYDSAPIGTGPYKYVSRNSGDNIVLEAFDQYYLGEAAIKNLTFKVITDTTTQIAALQKGEIDFLTHCPLTAKATVEDDGNLVWQETMFRGNIWVSMREDKAPFDNILARQAVQYAVDKDAMLIGGSEGLGQILKTIYPASVGASPEEEYTQPYTYDVEKAKQYLDQYKAETGVSDVKISILAPDTAMYLNPAITLEGMLREVGFDVTTEQIDRATFWASLYSGNFQIAVSGTSWPVADSDANYLYFHSTAGQNYFGVKDPIIDENLELGRSSSDENERREAYKKIQEEIDAQAVCVPLLQPANAVAYSANLKGVDKTNDIYQHYVYDWSW